MSSPYALYALTLVASHPALMFTIFMERLTTAARRWLPGVIAATQKKPDESKSRPVKGCDENGIPLDPNHHWNRERKPTGATSEPRDSNRQRRTEKSPATEFSRTAPSPYARGRIWRISHYGK